MYQTSRDLRRVEPVIEQLVRDYYDRLYRFAWRLSGGPDDAQDLVQQTFLVAQQKLEQLRDPDLSGAWLFSILRNTYLKSLRKQVSQSMLDLTAVPEPFDWGEEQRLIDSEEIQKALNELPEEFRTPVILFYLEQWSYREIADRLELPLGTVMSRLSRGRNYLRRNLQEVEIGSGSFGPSD